MKKLTIGIVSPYLEHNIDVLVYNSIEKLSMVNLRYLLASDTKLILYPLSMLTKEIEVNGEMFIPMDKLIPLIEQHQINLSKEVNKIEDIIYGILSPKKIIEFLYKCHFDLNNLIEKGLAIDKTLI